MLTKQANFLFEKKRLLLLIFFRLNFFTRLDFFRFAESAVVFAQTQTSFEEIALKFIDLKQTEALKAFLKKKLDSLSSKVVTISCRVLLLLIT